jgi:hypothetical protein
MRHPFSKAVFSASAAESFSEFKDYLNQCDEDPFFRAACFTLRLSAALDAVGFQDIRVRFNRYELPHSLWRFRFKIGSAHPTEDEIIRGVRTVCGTLGYAVAKDLISAIVSKGRASGLVILKPGWHRSYRDKDAKAHVVV